MTSCRPAFALCLGEPPPLRPHSDWFPGFAHAQWRWEGRSPSIELLTLSASRSDGDADLLLSALLTVLSTKG
ncbi:hypothetical protein XAC3615_14140013 [Xanthomonas citri pv. citri]|nr:hypothetical protein XAC3615_14140013 [Xanthomonas citri pv. citri]